MPTGRPIDRHALHRYFWRRRDRRDCIVVKQQDLAELLEVRIPTMSTIMKELQDQGRIKKIAAKERNVGVYFIRDPARWESGSKEEPKSA